MNKILLVMFFAFSNIAFSNTLDDQRVDPFDCNIVVTCVNPPTDEEFDNYGLSSEYFDLLKEIEEACRNHTPFGRGCSLSDLECEANNNDGSFFCRNRS